MTTPSILIRKEIDRFLKATDPEVLCISGAWGVGKTHLWKDVLTNCAHAKPALPLLSYSYVSLFGLEKLEDVKLSIFSNCISLEQGQLARVAQWSLSKAKSAQSILEQIPKVGELFKTLGAMYFSSVRRIIVCIDDLERRSKHLAVSDVLGLISNLKEERKCKVILLLNDDELGDASDEFRSYFEKTIDVHLRFAPTAEESASIAFASPGKLGERLGAHCISLGIRNIRIIRKIERAARELHPHIVNLDPEIQDSAIRSIVLLGWAHLKGSGAPSVEYLRKRNGLTNYNFDKERKLTEEEARWNAILDNFNWGALDELDHQIVEALEVGCFDPDAIKRAADAVWRRLEIQRLDGNFENAWKGYHESFENNQDQVLDGLFASFKQTYRTISFMNLDGTIRLFRELGRNEQAEELLKFYVDNRSEPQKFWDMNEYAFAGDIRDPGVRTAIDAKFKSFGNTQVNIGELLEAMGSTGKGWNSADVDAAAALPVGEYVQLFKTERGRKLNRIVNGGLIANRIANPTPGMKSVAESTLAALKEIAGESEINARRIANIYGVQFHGAAPAAPFAPVETTEAPAADVVESPQSSDQSNEP